MKQHSLNRTGSAIGMYNGKVMYSDKVSLIVVILF